VGLVERPRQARVLTDVFLVLSLALSVSAAVMIVLTALAITHPSYYGFAEAGIKAIGATVVVLFAISQAYTMEARLGLLPRGSLGVTFLLRAHQWGGRIALSLAALIAIFCLVDIGAATSPTRVLLHGILGSTAFLAAGIKFSLLRFRPGLGYRVAPFLGAYMVLAFIGIWFTSSYAYWTQHLVAP
jgi:hypothetical protein